MKPEGNDGYVLYMPGSSHVRNSKMLNSGMRGYSPKDKFKTSHRRLNEIRRRTEQRLTQKIWNVHTK